MHKHMTDLKVSTHCESIDPATSVNEILRRYPMAIAILNDHGIDTCCGGAAPLSAAAMEARTDPDAVIREIAAASVDASR
jgi:iron-sulfur cluster repair protein YtfE (RIC family)